MAFHAEPPPVQALQGSIDADHQPFVVKVAGDPDNGVPGALVGQDVQVMLKAVVDGLAQFTADQMRGNRTFVVGRDHGDADRLAGGKKLVKSDLLRLVKDDGRGMGRDFLQYPVDPARQAGLQVNLEKDFLRSGKVDYPVGGPYLGSAQGSDFLGQKARQFIGAGGIKLIFQN